MRTIIETESAAQALCQRLFSLTGPIGIDTETDGVDPSCESPIGRGRIVCWSLYHVDIGGVFIPNFSVSWLEVFRPWLECTVQQKVGHNLFSFDKHIFANHGITLNGILGDTMRMSKMWQNVEFGHDLKQLMQTHLGMKGPGSYKELFSRRLVLETVEETQLRTTKKKVGQHEKVPTLIGGACSRVSPTQRELIPLRTVPTEYPQLMPTLIEYAILDAEATCKLYPILAKGLATRKSKSTSGGTLYDMYTQIWNPYMDALHRMERNGVYVDRALCGELCERALAGEDDLRKDLSAWLLSIPGAPDPATFNWSSPTQLSDLIFQVLKLPRPDVMGSPKAIKKAGKGVYSTSEASMDWLWFRTEGSTKDALKKIVALRKAIRFRTHYLEKLLALQSPVGRVHASFKPTTDTGRIACSNPPLQQIPSKNSSDVRKVFRAPEGRKLVVVDFSQLEVFILGHMLYRLFGDSTIKEALEAGDVYSQVAVKVWPKELAGIDPGQLKSHPDPKVKAYRDYAKVVVLADIYGKTTEGLSVSLRDEMEGIGLERAQALMDDFRAAYPGVTAYQRWAEKFATENYGVPTLLGRWRPIPDARAKSRKKREAGYRQSYNSPIQGSAADVMACALLAVDKALPSTAAIVLNIHDELVVECNESEAEEVYRIVVDNMENPPYVDLAVKLRVDGKICDNWMEGK